MTDEQIIATYHAVGSIRGTAAVLHISHGKVKKVLISAGEYTNPRAAEINSLLEQGLSHAEIMERLHVSRSTIDANTPYTKGGYNAAEPTKNALRIRRSREKNREQEATE